MIYRFDMKNTSTNFHSYVDFHPNLLLVVKTQDNIFGAFTTGHFDP